MERELENPESVSTPQEETSTTPAPTPVVTPERPSTDTDGRALYLAVLGEKDRELASLRAQLNAKPAPAPVERQITPEEEQSFFATPKSATRSLIREELETQLAPLRNFVDSFGKKSAYDTLKDQIKRDPRFGAILTENESLVDQMLQGAEPTEANIKSAMLTIHGARSLGLIEGAPPINNPPAPNVPVILNGNPPPNQPANMSNIPPHLRPSAPAAPRDEGKQPVRPLSENEKRLAREWGMSDEEYRAGQQEGSLIIEPETTAKTKKKD